MMETEKNIRKVRDPGFCKEQRETGEGWEKMPSQVNSRHLSAAETVTQVWLHACGEHF